jgi:hypothetical protein
MRTTIQASSLERRTAAEQSYQDYLRISQNARRAAQAARRAASDAFWAAIADAVRSLARCAQALAGQHASVRLGAGHSRHHHIGA